MVAEGVCEGCYDCATAGTKSEQAYQTVSLFVDSSRRETGAAEAGHRRRRYPAEAVPCDAEEVAACRHRSLAGVAG
ncbi:hypothetical protein, partial [Methylobacterium sp. WL116]